MPLPLEVDNTTAEMLNGARAKTTGTTASEVRRGIHPRGGRILGSGTRLPPPPPPAHRAHLVPKGQWLRAIHRVAPKGPKIFIPFAGNPRECRG